ncbi:ABC transporter permease [Xaviernesmea oryzae]|uniref:ABC transporter permease n=1 Tax=Xaviernesmea oryzae TaxID=464029 RepID=A0A1Q9AZY0_9HYPH|nr:DMT family transporter [Xaviernesmea oryzae]OLP61279.1 ABC transporter permease [Xaviernesmea oryzae]SEL53317.1 Uncharacterized membrane protein [Xaviernesmea oryzae]
MTAAPAPRMNLLTWGLLFLLGLLWGGSFFFARVAVGHVPPFTLVFLRLSLAAIVLHLLLRGGHGLYGALAGRWRGFLLLGLVNNAIPHAFIFLGQTQIGAGLASILNATTPIWTVLIAHLLTADERMTGKKIAGCILGLCGTAVLLGPAALATLFSGDHAVPFWALLLPLLAAVSYGFAGTYGKSFKGLNPTVIATGQLTASSLIMLPVSLAVDHPWTLAMPPASAVLAVVALALLSTAFGYILFFRIMAVAGATNTSLVTLLVPPSAILLGALFLGERLAMTDMAGMVLIGLGLVVLDGRALGVIARGKPA